MGIACLCFALASWASGSCIGGEAAPDAVCDRVVHPPYAKWISEMRDPVLRAKACAAAESLDSHVPVEVIAAAGFFHARRAKEVLIEALERTRSDYAAGRLLAYVIDLAAAGDAAVVAALLDDYRKIDGAGACCNTEATQAREELKSDFVRGMAKLAGLDLYGIAIDTDEGRAYVVEDVEDWLRTR